MAKRYADVLHNWTNLLDYVRENTDEKDLAGLIKAEQTGLNRPTFVDRIYSRLSAVRREREKAELDL